MEVVQLMQATNDHLIIERVVVMVIDCIDRVTQLF